MRYSSSIIDVNLYHSHNSLISQISVFSC